MISPWMTKIIGKLPEGLLKYISNKVMYGYINKYADLTVKGDENLDNIKKPVIYICNHLSNADGLVLNSILREKDDVTFVAGVKLNNNSLTNLGMHVVKTTPVKPNTPDKDGLKKIINIVKEGGSILIFPEGTRSRQGKLIEAKKGITLIAKLTKVNIVPIAITGTENLLPISQSGRMEREKFQHAKVTVTVGKEFVLPKIEKDEDKKDFEERCLNTFMYKIAEMLPDEYKGVYNKSNLG
ncbi:lysophospholipid acyltransferase family protein [Clostridium grantii]|uniref:1-acyl-sn-glycerol-3-phosphate acyltransferase n=1 Tax=Clostridium grantii DSM 8605 TaxID=1121316 RepID=A0A1M5RS70_9CLOT|nr:lysophospholipid acyltransferase family protein [Clostridium grantii]SHH28989.1 1-acyl-sn-glycerol-3-phosphate acyltransferase [Clostridium grantii DSM 8605]